MFACLRSCGPEGRCEEGREGRREREEWGERRWKREKGKGRRKRKEGRREMEERGEERIKERVERGKR